MVASRSWISRIAGLPALCRAGKLAGGSLFEQLQKDVVHFEQDNRYAHGWSDGFRQYDSELGKDAETVVCSVSTTPWSLVAARAACLRPGCQAYGEAWRDQRGDARVGFVGLGNLGRHLATNLLHCGFEVTVHDLDPGAGGDGGASGRSRLAAVAGAPVGAVSIQAPALFPAP